MIRTRQTGLTAWGRGALAAACVVGTMAVGPAQAEPCGVSQQKALDVRLLQTELMVSALACGERAAYNTFVQQQRTSLTEYGRHLKALFHDVYGLRADNKLNAFVTRLANQASARHAANYTEFCERTARTLVALNAGATLRSVATRHPLSGTAGREICRSDRAVQQATTEVPGQPSSVQ